MRPPCRKSPCHALWIIWALRPSVLSSPFPGETSLTARVAPVSCGSDPACPGCSPPLCQLPRPLPLVGGVAGWWRQHASEPPPPPKTTDMPLSCGDNVPGALSCSPATAMGQQTQVASAGGRGGSVDTILGSGKAQDSSLQLRDALGRHSSSSSCVPVCPPRTCGAQDSGLPPSSPGSCAGAISRGLLTRTQPRPLLPLDPTQTPEARVTLPLYRWGH